MNRKYAPLHYDVVIDVATDVIVVVITITITTIVNIIIANVIVVIIIVIVVVITCFRSDEWVASQKIWKEERCSIVRESPISRDLGLAVEN